MSAWTSIIGLPFTAEQFRDYVRGMVLHEWSPEFVVLHNTAVPTMANWHLASGYQRMQNLQVYYRDTQHWSAGPHLFVADDFIWTFTPLWLPGVHSPSWNRISWGVETVGDYEVELLPPTVKENLLAALETLHRLGHLDPRTLRLHKEDPKTTHNCPGKNLASLKDELISTLVARLAPPPVDTGAPRA